MVASFKKRRTFTLSKKLVGITSFIFYCSFLFLVSSYCASFFDPNPLLKQASLSLEKGDFLGALDAYQLVYTYSQDRDIKAKSLVRQADIYALFLDKKEEAKNIYQQAIEAFPHSLELKNAYFNLAMLAYEDYDLNTSKTYFTLFIQKFSEDIRVYTAKYMLERINREEKQQIKKETKEIETISNRQPIVRVLLARSDKIDLLVEKEFYTAWGKFQKGKYVFKIQDGKIEANGKLLGRVLSSKGVKGFYFQDKKYKGEFKIQLKGNELLLINFLPLESYLEGVVAKEMSPSWPLAALQAQAVAARTYAYYIYLKSQDKDYDLSSSTASQVYAGVSESDRVQQAVLTTQGEVLTYANKPILAYFHAHSGGVLEKSKNVWKVDFPYFEIKEDPYSLAIKRIEWQTEVSKKELERVLKNKGFSIGSIQKVEVGDISPSGRIINLKIVALEGQIVLASNSLRLWLGPTKIKSTLAAIDWQGKRLVLSGKGYGHGVGMSQWGAYDLAKKGKSYRDILNFYYPKTILKKLY